MYVADRALFLRWLYAEDNPLQYAEVTGYDSTTGAAVTWQRLFTRPQDTSFSTGMEPLPSRSHVVTVTGYVTGMSAANRDELEAVVRTRNVAVIVKDKNGRFWLLGENEGVRFRVWQGQTEGTGGDNRWQIVGDSRERYQVREVTFNLSTYTPTGYTPDAPVAVKTNATETFYAAYLEAASYTFQTSNTSDFAVLTNDVTIPKDHRPYFPITTTLLSLPYRRLRITDSLGRVSQWFAL